MNDEDYGRKLSSTYSQLQSARDDLREVEGRFLELSGWEEVSEAGMWRHPDFADQARDPLVKVASPIFAQKTALAVAEALYAAGRRRAAKSSEDRAAVQTSTAETSPTVGLTEESLECAVCGNMIPPGAAKIEMAVGAQRFRHPAGSPLCRHSPAAKQPPADSAAAPEPEGEQAARIAIAKARSLLSYALDEAARLGVEVRFSFTTVGGQKAWYLIKGVESFHFGEIQ